MIRSRFLRSSVLVLSAFVALSCSDVSPTAPAAAPVSAIRAGTQQDALLGGLLGGLVGGLLKTVLSIVGFVPNANVPVNAVAWSPAYADHSYTVTGVITSRGGTLTIPETDFTITFPMGAVSGPTAIRIDSDPKHVAYAMFPHMRFAKPLVVTQRLRHTVVAGRALPSPIFGAYVDETPLDAVLGLFKATEIELSATLSAPGSSTLPEITTWTVNHFSRYMLASG